MVVNAHCHCLLPSSPSICPRCLLIMCQAEAGTLVGRPMPIVCGCLWSSSLPLPPPAIGRHCLSPSTPSPHPFITIICWLMHQAVLGGCCVVVAVFFFYDCVEAKESWSSSSVAVIVISSFIPSRHLLIVASTAKWKCCRHWWHRCRCCVIVVIIVVVIAAIAIDQVKLDNGVELSSSSALPPPPRQQIWGQRHAAEVPRLSASMWWWLAATTACCCGRWGRNGFGQLYNHGWHRVSQPRSCPCEVLAFKKVTGAKCILILLMLPHCRPPKCTMG